MAVRWMAGGSGGYQVGWVTDQETIRWLSCGGVEGVEAIMGRLNRCFPPPGQNPSCGGRAGWADFEISPRAEVK